MFAGLEPRLPSWGRPLHAFHFTKFFMLKPVFKKVWLQRNMDLIKQLSNPNDLMLEKQTAKYELCAKTHTILEHVLIITSRIYDCPGDTFFYRTHNLNAQGNYNIRIYK